MVFHDGLKFKAVDYFKYDVILLKLVANYCKKKNIKLKVLSKYPGEIGLKEIDYYKNQVKIESINYILNKRSNNISKIYKLSDEHLVTISTHSTFGLENLARYNKTAIFHTRKNQLKI